MSGVVEDAVRRLQAAIGVLEAHLGRRLEAERQKGDLETELQIMQDDRVRLAVELELTAARLGRVESATESAEERLGAAIQTIEHVLVRAEARPEA